jgi:small subunit ribosomal protein S23
MPRDPRPARMLQTAHNLLSTKRISARPPWMSALQAHPPSEPTVRQPLKLANPLRPAIRNKKLKKSGNRQLFGPSLIKYEEDALRKQFFGDHPWELARPRTVLEGSAEEWRHWDWSKMKQVGKPVDGERYVILYWLQ